jgi:hypothetical protein
MLSSPNACPIIVSVTVALYNEICKTSGAHSLSDPSRNRIRPRPKISPSTDPLRDILYADSQDMLVLPALLSCIEVLQLMYRWQHESQKLRIAMR